MDIRVQPHMSARKYKAKAYFLLRFRGVSILVFSIAKYNYEA
jgi:hypothetical protein